MYFMELALGQFASTSSVKVWEMVPFFKGVGYGQMMATFCVCSYYTILIALGIYYLLASLTTVLPWTVCDPSIVLNNTVCIDSAAGIAMKNGSAVTKYISSSEQYFL